MSTASGLLFNATYEGFIEALDAGSGDQLWSFNLGTGSNGGIVSYEANGKQYVAITTGHGSYVGRAVASLWPDEIVNYQETTAVVAFELP
ncbi:MAG: pyrroloquinoline quinone-dependent dehydrogenase, partial [Geminicoccaceae bacterium]